MADSHHHTFEELYESTKRRVYNLAYHYVQNENDAQEITQDVYVSVHQSLANFQGGSTIETWIYRIAINRSLDFIKASKRKKRFAHIASIFGVGNEVRYETPDLRTPQHEKEQEESVALIMRGIEQLKDQQRTAIILHKLEGQSQTEVATIMNISPKAVESLVQRAKANLLIWLKENEG